MRFIHWGTVAVLLGTYAVAWTIDNAANPAEKEWLIMLHRSFGFTLLLITGVRLFVRRRTRIPPLPPGLSLAQRVAAKIGAVSLYVLLIMQPLLGFVASLLHGDRVVLFGGLVLPRLLPRDRTLAHALFHLHGAAASLFLAVIGLHALAALYHHFIRKDHVLAGMLPGLKMLSGGPGSVP